MLDGVVLNRPQISLRHFEWRSRVHVGKNGQILDFMSTLLIIKYFS